MQGGDLTKGGTLCSTRYMRCFSCGRTTGKNPHRAVTSDLAQIVYVGSECYKLIGDAGYQPPLGGPRLYRAKFNASGEVVEVIGEKEKGETRPSSQERCPKCGGRGYHLQNFADNFFTTCARCLGSGSIRKAIYTPEANA